MANPHLCYKKENNYLQKIFLKCEGFSFNRNKYSYNSYGKGANNMRNTQKTLYKIGSIINWVLMGIFALIILINIILLIVDAVNDRGIVDNISTIVTYTIFLALVIVLLILVKKFEEDALKAQINHLAPVILLMVFGVLSWNLLYTVGGVFGIIAASQENNSEDKAE